MKLFLCLFALGMASAVRYNVPSGAVLLRDVRQAGPVSILSETNEPHTGDGSYSFKFDSEDGTSVQEQGYLKDGPEGAAVAVQGGFSYTSLEGQPISLQYTADENGFAPQGAHLPTPPPIPEAILKSIQFNEAEEARGGGQQAPTNNIYRTENPYQYQKKRSYNSV